MNKKPSLDTVLTLTVEQLIEACASVSDSMQEKIGRDFPLSLLFGIFTAELSEAIIKVINDEDEESEEFEEGDEVCFVADESIKGIVADVDDDGTVGVKIGKHGTTVYAEKGAIKHVGNQYN